MSRAIIIASIVFSLTFGFQSAFLDFMPTAYVEPEVTIEVTEEFPEENQNEIPEEILDELMPDFLEDGYVYMSSAEDYWVIFPGKEWYTDYYEPITFFFNYNTLDEYSSLALSSTINPIPESDRKSYTDDYMNGVTNNSGNIAFDVELVEMENYNFRDYTAYRYNLTSTLNHDGKAAEAIYLFWWIGNRAYVCSAFASQDDLDFLSSAMYDMLDTFQQPSAFE